MRFTRFISTDNSCDLVFNRNLNVRVESCVYLLPRFRLYAIIVFSQEVIIERFVKTNKDRLEMHRARIDSTLALNIQLYPKEIGADEIRAALSHLAIQHRR